MIKNPKSRVILIPKRLVDLWTLSCQPINVIKAMQKLILVKIKSCTLGTLRVSLMFASRISMSSNPSNILLKEGHL